MNDVPAGQMRSAPLLAAIISVAILAVACQTSQATPAPTPGAGTQAPSTSAPTTPGPVADGKLPILAAIPNAPTRPPRPTPDPSATPAPERTLPPANTRQIMFYTDTVTAGPGESKFNVDADRYCTISSSFRRGMHVVWRVIAYDNTGRELQTSNVESATLSIPGVGEAINFRYGPHGGDNWFWTAAWDVPMDYPLGFVDFTIEFKTTDGKADTYKQIQVSAPDRGIESRLNIIG